MHVTEHLPAYALGCSDEQEAAQVAEHLAACPACRAELRAYVAVADELALASPCAEPPARVKQRIMRQVQQPRLVPAALPRVVWWQSLGGLFQSAAPALALGSLVLVVALGALSVWLWRQGGSNSQPIANGMQVVALASTDAAPGAAGTLVISADGEYGSLVADGLSPLDAAHQYQVWMVRDGQYTSGGVFLVNPHGYGVLEIHAPEPLIHFPVYVITVEPTGGSPGPTGDRVLEGKL